MVHQMEFSIQLFHQLLLEAQPITIIYQIFHPHSEDQSTCKPENIIIWKFTMSMESHKAF
jgi:hypothetical protein